MNEIIEIMFKKYWTGSYTLSCMDKMRAELHKNLTGQINGYWSGSSSYKIMVEGGFLVDAKSTEKKRLTEFGKMFMRDFEANGQ